MITRLHNITRRDTRAQLELEFRVRAEELAGLSSSATAADVLDQRTADAAQPMLWDDAGSLILRAEMIGRADAPNYVGCTTKASLPNGKWYCVMQRGGWNNAAASCELPERLPPSVRPITDATAKLHDVDKYVLAISAEVKTEEVAAGGAGRRPRRS